ncbi:unnamed protein product [Bubo scandiacus]
MPQTTSTVGFGGLQLNPPQTSAGQTVGNGTCVCFNGMDEMQAEYNRKGDLDAGVAAESDALELSTDSKIKCKI